MKKLTLLLLGALLFLSCSRQKVATIQPNKMERIVNLEDLKEYIEWDIENGKDKDGTLAIYVEIIEETLILEYK